MQRSFDELGRPLREVTFCVVDLETTGGCPADDRITEVGAMKVQGGQPVGTFATLVNPGRPIPPTITVLTGITSAMVLPAPGIDAVLPALLEFVGDSVVVGHNLRFDLAFIGAALERTGRRRLTGPTVDTCALARRLVRDEVPDCRLGTLASRLRLSHQPTHRALDDVLATVDLLHALLERAATWGVLGLDDLLALPKLAGHPQAAKLRLTTSLPRAPGVYLLRDGGGRVLYVGRATNLRARVRSYFSGDDRRKVGPLLRETASVEHIVCTGTLEAAVREVRLIHELVPRYNRRAKAWRSRVYLKLTAERFPRLSVVRVARPDGAHYLGPLPSTRAARRVAEAVEAAVPLRRCTARVTGGVRAAPCMPAQLGVATCPCAGQVSEDDYRALVDRVVRGLTSDPEALLAPLQRRMAALAAAERFEEAADVRDRGAALAGALRAQRRWGALRRAGRLVVELPDGGGAELHRGRLVRAWGPSDTTGAEHQPTLPWSAAGAATEETAVARDMADELACVAGWLDANAHRVRLVHCEGGLASPWPVLPSFEPGRRTPAPATPAEPAPTATRRSRQAEQPHPLEHMPEPEPAPPAEPAPR